MDITGEGIMDDDGRKHTLGGHTEIDGVVKVHTHQPNKKSQ